MYHLPTDFDFAVFVGKEVELVCFSANSIFIHFENNLSLTIEGGFDHIDANNVVLEPDQTFPMKQSILMRLVTQKVTSVKVEGDDILELIFSNGDGLRLYGVYGYESYHIRYGDREIHV